LIDGKTQLIAHIGYPTESFRAPMLYNPWFASKGIPAVVVPMGVRPEHFESSFEAIMRLSNLRGALITMPFKVSAMACVDTHSVDALIAGACNAVARLPDGRLAADQFDGIGFVRALQRKGLKLQGLRALVCGCGGVGSAIAASLAQAGIGELCLFDVDLEGRERLARRLREHYPDVRLQLGSNDPDGFDLVCNASPLGMREEDPLVVDPGRLAPTSFVADVVMKREITPLLAAARERGCPIQTGVDMLFEMIPAYLAFFGFPAASSDDIRATAQLRY
jgi:shikimate dehydrogenase